MESNVLHELLLYFLSTELDMLIYFSNQKIIIN